MIAIVDYGMGNLRSVQKGFESAGATVVVTSDPGVIRGAAAVVVPGVGAFHKAMMNIRPALEEPILEAVEAGKPFLGICLGFQLLFSVGLEGGPTRGLDLIGGEVRRFSPSSGVRVPHIGWNQLRILRESPVTSGIPDGSYVYFAHSFRAFPGDWGVVVAETEYGEIFPSVVQKGNVFGLQFHPEKSSQVGLRMLRNFVSLLNS
ncbi:MAG: imidazole glycerol phosphate synthase subunit HisH [Firmicutes bacterium]|nr:imidazole glycerol phosphate synthase subunit HisH [Bacillota bacterium]